MKLFKIPFIFFVVFQKYSLHLSPLWKNSLMLIKRYLTITFWFFPLLCFAEWTNVIINYSRNDYKAGSQNWQIIQADNQWMYFANKTGILEYNGKHWNLYSLQNNVNARSLFCSKKDNRIYVGGINEIGYLELASDGKKHYHSIETSSDSLKLHLGNVWKIYEIDKSIYFCGDQMVAKWVNKVLIPIYAPDKIDCSSLINNTLYIGTTSGIFVLAGEAFYRLPNTEAMAQEKLRAILPFGNKIMIATAREGLFLWDENGLTPFHTDADEFMKKNEVFSVAVHDNQIAIGTVLKGLVLITSEGKLLKYINELHGLQNNTILSLYFDVNSNLWLGLDNGIDYVVLNYPITNLYAASGFYGAGYVARLFKGKLYLGTNRGLYVTDWPVSQTELPPQLRLIDGSQGQVWNLQVVDNSLFICHDKGLFVIDSKDMKGMDLHAGVWEVRPMKQAKNKYWISTYNGFYTMEKDTRRKWKIRPISSPPSSALNGSTITFEEGSNNQLFLQQSRSEVVRISINDEQNQVENEKNYHGVEVPEDFLIHQLMDKIILSSPSGFYVYDSNEHFVPDAETTQFFEFSGKNNSFRSILQTPTAVWALGEDALSVKYDNSSVTCYHTIPLITNFERIFPVSDSLVIIPNENGFALWNTAASIKKSDYPLQITDIRIIKGNPHQEENTMRTDTIGILRIPYRNNSLVVEYGVISYFNPHKILYRTRLDNNEWSSYSSADSKALFDVPIGSHTFKVETQLENGKILEDSFSFIVLPPWYLTTEAYITYGILLIFLLFFAWSFENRRIEYKEQKMKKLQEKEMELKEEAFKTENEKKEQEITRLTNEKLEMDIQHKSQELANSAIILGRKNEVLIEIKKSLSGIFDPSGHEIASQELKRKIMDVNYLIDENIREDDIIHRFEENFDLVHNNFIKRLTEVFPTLSVAERKMCTFIKMQLSSKEIAPLLNITVRGVETMRLRLRKKLGLQNESLTKFLSNF